MGTAKEGKTTSGTSMTNIDIEKLDTDNYTVWSVKMKAFLIIKELWSAGTPRGHTQAVMRCVQYGETVGEMHKVLSTRL